MTKIKCVTILTPYAGDIELHKMYTMLCCKDSIARGEAPFASHLIYPILLEVYSIQARQQRIACGFSWLAKSDIVAIYTDLGLSIGMLQSKAHAKKLNIKTEDRSIGNVQWLKSYRQAL